jgi:hypothetical protein
MGWRAGARARARTHTHTHRDIHFYIQRGPKKCTHFLIVNIFGTKLHVVTILAWYCSVMFAHVCICERFYLQQDGAPPHYHRHVRAYLYDTLPGRWIGRRGAIGYSPRSPDLTPLLFYLWGTLKDEVYRQKPHVQPSHQTH